LIKGEKLGVVKFLIFLIAFVGLAGFVFAAFKWKRVEGGINAGNIRGVEKVPVGRFIVSTVLLITLLVFFSAIQIIPAGYRGVIFSQGSGVKSRILNEGFNIVTPAIEQVIPMEVRVQKHPVTAAAASKDTQNVKTVVAINYHFDPKKVHKIYQNYGLTDEVNTRIIAPKTQDAIKRSTAKFDAEDMIANRDKLGDMILATLGARLAKSHIIIDDVSVENISFDDDFMLAIEDKVKQKQLAKKAQLIVVTKEAEAKQAVAEAEGIKQARILKAEGTARANELKDRTLTDKVLYDKWLDSWDGKSPLYLSGGGNSAIFQLPAAAQ